MGEEEEEDHDFKRVLMENKIMPSKKTLVIVCVLGIVALFILIMVNIRDTKGVLHQRHSLVLDEQASPAE